MRPLWWVIIVTTFIVIAFGLVIGGTLLIWDKWIWTPLLVLIGFLVLIGIIIGAIFLWIKLKKKEPERLKANVKTGKARAIQIVKDDEDNPDNLLIENTKLERHGEKGKERTPILIIEGKGMELNQERIIILNLNNLKEFSNLTNPSKKEKEDAIRLLAENPEDRIEEERRLGQDVYGRPTETLITRRAGSVEKEEEKKRELEEINKL